MPYTIRYVRGDERPYKIINSITGEVVGSSKSEEAADRSINARNAGAHGAKLGRKKR